MKTMKSNLSVGGNILGYQMAFFGFSIFVVTAILAWAIFSGNGNYFVMTFVAALLLGGANLFSAKFSTVTVEEDFFLVKNFFKPKRAIKLALFNKIEQMDTILFMPASPYFAILLKTGEKIYFVAQQSEKTGYAFLNKEKLARHITGEIDDFIKMRGFVE